VLPVNPEGTASFYLFDNAGNGPERILPEKAVNMIGHAVDNPDGTAGFFQLIGNKHMHRFLNGWLYKRRFFLGAPDRMDPDAG